ncbi:MAG: hypothetical protein NVS2B8_21440 [Vulcanimicrobiaceae bacterium]
MNVTPFKNESDPDALQPTGRDPREPDVRDADDLDPHSGASDDPRVDPTPDGRQSDASDLR